MIPTKATMQHRAFPVARTFHSSRKAATRGKVRRVLTFFAAALIFGGLLRLATDRTTVDVASRDLTDGATQAASSQRQRDAEEDRSRDGSGDHDTKAERARDGVDPFDVAIVTMLIKQDRR